MKTIYYLSLSMILTILFILAKDYIIAHPDDWLYSQREVAQVCDLCIEDYGY